MSAPERPQLRPYLLPVHDSGDPQHVYLIDQLGIAPEPARLPRREFLWLLLFDGQRTLRDIQAEAMRLAGGEIIPIEKFAHLAERLQEALVLDGPRFRAVADAPVREPRCIGCYEGEPEPLRRQLERLFTGPKGPGLPRTPRPAGRLRAALIPHIDYPRGGSTYAWGFKEVFEQTDASLFVIIGTSHCAAHPLTLGHSGQRASRFTLTRKDFKTPLGIARTDQDYIDRLVRHHGPGLFDDELMAHLPEHSIELEVVFLQYLYEKVRPIRIVPLVVSSFHDCVASGEAPSRQEDVQRMIQALRRAEEETKEPICYIISGDLAHIGRKFTPYAPPLTAPILEHSRAQDQAILRQTEAASALDFFRVIADESDSRNICGLPPTYTVLEAARPGRGKVLHYDQYVHPRGFESVSFASVAFYR
ncbi:MAG: AmmeMemoRadiSam system protein B [Gemmataceae bacterium]|nr:AmmeMemoRadiSam system protein B [Gemmataceae bacterium]